jgi:uncharacterized membrane protein HdeD (DUF308 family)
MFVILAHNWWTLLLRGIIALVFGLLCFAYPSVTLLVMTMMFGVYALLDGILALASSLPRHRVVLYGGARSLKGSSASSSAWSF